MNYIQVTFKSEVLNLKYKSDFSVSLPTPPYTCALSKQEVLSCIYLLISFVILSAVITGNVL